MTSTKQRRELPPCPTPYKKSHPSKQHAENAMHKFWRKPKKGTKMPCRVYRCQCGAWHTTSRPIRETA